MSRRVVVFLAAIVVGVVALSGCTAATSAQIRVAAGATGAVGSTGAVAGSGAVGSSDAQPTPVPLTPTHTVLFIGDSIMRGHGLTADEQSWPDLVGTNYGVDVVNIACDGAGFVVYGDCGNTYAGLVTQAVGSDPDTVIIQGSSNDFGEDNDKLLTSTVDDLQTLRALLPTAQIIGLSAVASDDDTTSQISDVDYQVDEAVTAVGGTYVDIGLPLQDHPEWMQSDDVHPTGVGQAAIFLAVQDALTSHNLYL